MRNYLAIEELARLEQRRALKKGKFVNMFNTSTIQNLKPEQKKEFFHYLKRKKRPIKLLASFLFLAVLGFFIFNRKLTGLPVINNDKTSSAISFVFIVLAIVFAVLIFAFVKRRKNIETRFKEHIEIAERRLH